MAGIISDRIKLYAQLIRFKKPIGVWLLLWPTWWALWLASAGMPNWRILVIFTIGTFLMRSAGCIVNDIADRHVDGFVERTRQRPLASGAISVSEALLFAGILSFIAFMLVVLFCNSLTVMLAIAGALFTLTYPLLKRVTHLPQLGLGVAFSWGVPMAFAAVKGAVPSTAWLLFFTCMLWPVIYDTMYAMVDREDDIKIGVKSSAILFGEHDKMIIALLQISFIALLAYVGVIFKLQAGYQYCVLMAALLFVYQQWLIKDRIPVDCFAAFLNNASVGLVIFIGVLWGQV